jgi:hypothetical protein
MTKNKVEMTTHNNTDLTLEQIKALPLLGVYRNNWRQRDVVLYRFAADRVISVGTSFDRGVRVIALESDADHFRALDAFAYGRQYVAE